MKPLLDQVLARLTRDATRDFARYWFGIRAGRAVPDRRDIDPSVLVHLLPKLWLWEYRPELGDFVNRLTGGEIVAVFQRSPRGMTLGSWVPPGISSVARPRYQRVIDQPAICVAAGASFVTGESRAWCERVIAPMTNGADKPTVVFGITVWEAPDFSTGPVEREETEAEFFPIAV